MQDSLKNGKGPPVNCDFADLDWAELGYLLQTVRVSSYLF